MKYLFILILTALAACSKKTETPPPLVIPEKRIVSGTLYLHENRRNKAMSGEEARSLARNLKVQNAIVNNDRQLISASIKFDLQDGTFVIDILQDHSLLVSNVLYQVASPQLDSLLKELKQVLK